jgi:NAD(P)-dependent dehydrogenase (short-subunit alcohol dehydrogenase family)
MGCYAVTGSASGIGAAARKLLEDRGHDVIGVDLAGQEVEADLSKDEGRRRAVAEVERRCGARLDGMVLAAGLGASHAAIERIVAVNYFGCIAFLEGLRDAVAKAGGAAVAVASNTALALPDYGGPLEDVCLAGRESDALAGATQLDGPRCYVVSKRALIRFVRREAPGWMQSGARLNAIAPGPVRTPLLSRDLAHPEIGPRLEEFPIPAGEPAEPGVIADAIGFLLDHPYCCGTVLCVDGGGDAQMRPDSF